MSASDWFVIMVFLFLSVSRPIHLFRGRSHLIKGRIVRPWLQPLQLGSFYLVIVLSLMEYFFLDRTVIWPVAIPVIAVILETKIIKEMARKSLGAYWSSHVELRSGHPVIEAGPYEFIRHPSYLNGIIEALTVPLLSSSWFTMCLAVIITPIVFRSRILTEERGMREAAGEAYIDYCLRVPRFIPVRSLTAPIHSFINKHVRGNSFRELAGNGGKCND